MMQSSYSAHLLREHASKNKIWRSGILECQYDGMVLLATKRSVQGIIWLSKHVVKTLAVSIDNDISKFKVRCFSALCFSHNLQISWGHNNNRFQFGGQIKVYLTDFWRSKWPFWSANSMKKMIQKTCNKQVGIVPFLPQTESGTELNTDFRREFDFKLEYELTTISFLHYQKLSFKLTSLDPHITLVLIVFAITGTHAVFGFWAFGTLAFSSIIHYHAILVWLALMERACIWVKTKQNLKVFTLHYTSPHYTTQHDLTWHDMAWH